MRRLLVGVSIGWLLACGGFGASDEAHGDEEEEELVDPSIEEAECCLDPKRWEASEQGWQSWRVDSFEVEPGEYQKVTVALTKGLRYRFEACGASEVVDVDLLLYDTTKKVAVRDDVVGREPVIEFTAVESGAHHLLVYMRKTTTGKAGAVAYGWASLTGDSD